MTIAADPDSTDLIAFGGLKMAFLLTNSSSCMACHMMSQNPSILLEAAGLLQHKSCIRALHNSAPPHSWLSKTLHGLRASKFLRSHPIKLAQCLWVNVVHVRLGGVAH